MDKISNLALVLQMIESAEKNIQSAKALLREMAGIKNGNSGIGSSFGDKLSSLNVSDGGKIVEGIFDGQNMIGPDEKQYPVPANYASKSKLIKGDVLKLTILEDGSFVYKQIGPVERRKIVGLLTQDERGDYRVIADGKTYKVLLASITYFKASAGNQVTIVVPKDEDCEWAAVENVIASGDVDAEMGSTEPVPTSTQLMQDIDDEF